LVTSNLSGVIYNNANLEGSSLYGADLSRADLSKAILSYADLTNANLRGAIVDDAQFSGVILYNTIMPSGYIEKSFC